LDRKAEEEIITILRRGSSAAEPDKGRGFEKKFAEWPTLIAGKEVKVSEQLRKTLSEFNKVRGLLTHPKTRGYEVYADLEAIDGQQLLESVAEYAIAVFGAVNERYPYWLFGWNYLNANAAGFDPFRINDGQFLHSLDYLGLKVPSFDANAAKAWKEVHLKSFESYKRIARFLSTCPPCEPFDPQFPHRPRLVKHWWDAEVFEKNKSFVKKRSLPIICGTVAISPAIMAPIHIEARPLSGAGSEQSK